MSLVLAFLALPIAAWLALPLASDILSLTLLAFRRVRLQSVPSATVHAESQRLCFLVPAHNEALLVERCVTSLHGMERRTAQFDVVVVADNCTDETGALARAAGAVVLERADATRRGKPAAIAWALAKLPLQRYDAVVIVDADSLVDRNFADAIAQGPPLRNAAAQTYNGIANRSASWLSRLAGLLITARYDGQFRLKAHAALSCPMANGMVMGTETIARLGWPADSLTENWEMFARYVAAGIRVSYLPRARLGSEQAKALAESGTQRRRWQAGRSDVLRRYASPILRSRETPWRQKVDAIAELSAPGPVLQSFIAAVGAAVMATLPGRLAALVAFGFAASVLHVGTWTLWALKREPDPALVIRALFRLPQYAVWRVLIALGTVSTSRRKAWLRSPRPSEHSRQGRNRSHG